MKRGGHSQTHRPGCSSGLYMRSCASAHRHTQRHTHIKYTHTHTHTHTHTQRHTHIKHTHTHTHTQTHTHTHTHRHTHTQTHTHTQRHTHAHIKRTSFFILNCRNETAVGKKHAMLLCITNKLGTVYWSCFCKANLHAHRALGARIAKEADRAYWVSSLYRAAKAHLKLG